MKASQIQVDADQLLQRLDKMKSTGYIDPNMLQFKIGEPGRPARNKIRPVGDFETCRIHYIGNVVPNIRDSGLPFYVVCIGRDDCPMCQVGNELTKIATKSAKDKTRDFWSTERNYWNVIPRWEYDWGDIEPKMLVLSFASIARGTLEDVVTDYGHPGAFETGYVLNYNCEKKAKGARGANYEFKAVVERQKEGTKLVTSVAMEELSEDEGEWELVDLTTYSQPPEPDVLEELQGMFDIGKIIGKSKSRSGGRSKDVTDEVDVDEEDEEDETEEELKADEADDDKEVEATELEEVETEADLPLCYADPNFHDPKDAVCIECPAFKPCKREIKMEMIKNATK